MSNALYNLAAAVADQIAAAPPPPPVADPLVVPGWMMCLLAIGILLSAVWLVRRIVYPQKFTLVGTPGRSNRIHPAYILALILGGFVLAQIATMVAGKFLPEEPALIVIASAATFVGVLLGALVVAEKCFDLGAVNGMGLTLRHWRTGTIRGVIAALIALPATWGLLRLTRLIVQWLNAAPNKPHAIFTAIDNADVPWKIVIMLLPIVLAPLAEEIFFRGLIQSTLRQYTGRPWVAILISSALFGVVHSAVWTTIPSLIVFAIILGYNYERTGRLLPSIVAHAIFNAIGVLQHMTTSAT